MAVVARKRTKGLVYYVANEWQGKQTWEKVGPHKRQAEQRDRAMKKEIADGTYQAQVGARATTVRQHCEAWGSRRTNASAPDELRCIRLYVASREWLADMRLDEVRPTHIDRLVRELRSEQKPDGSRRLSDKTIANALGVLRLVFASAIREDLCIRQPVTLEPGTLNRRPAEERETYTAAEVGVLIRHSAIPWPIRVLNALVLLAGVREGEACGRRWRDLGDGSPLAGMMVRDQYDGRPLKTRRPRVVPIHPELGHVLEEWANQGFELYTRRKPEPDDFIVPNTSKRARVRCHSRSSYYKAFIRSARAAGIAPRSLHATRHTFVSLCRRGGAPKDVIERVTHNSRGDIVDRYTHFDWEPLCRAVLCLKLDSHQAAHLPPGNPGNSRGLLPATIPTTPKDAAPLPVDIPGSIPGASTPFQRDYCGFVKPRQGRRQGNLPLSLGNAAESSDPEALEFAIAVGEQRARSDAFGVSCERVPAVVRVALARREFAAEGAP